MMILRRALDLPQVRLDCPDVSQRFFNTLAKTVLPNVDDTDNNMRQEAHKFLADLVKRNCSSPDVGSILDKVPPHRRSAFEEEWKKVAKDLPCPWGFAAAAEQEEKPKASATGRRPSPRGKVRDSDASSAAQSRPASPRREGPTRGDVPSPPARERSMSRHASPARQPRAASASTQEEQPSKQQYDALHAELRQLRSLVTDMQKGDAKPAAAPRTTEQALDGVAAA